MCICVYGYEGDCINGWTMALIGMGTSVQGARRFNGGDCWRVGECTVLLKRR